MKNHYREAEQIQANVGVELGEKNITSIDEHSS